MDESQPQNESVIDEQVKKNNPLVIVGLVALAAVVGVGVFVASRAPQASDTTEGTTVGTSAVSTPEIVAETAGDATTSAITVEGANFSFTPNEIKVKKGDPVIIVFKNTGGFHDFVIDEFNVKTAQIGDGKEETVTFTPDKAGSFEFYCSVGQHRKNGMKGTLIVE